VWIVAIAPCPSSCISRLFHKLVSYHDKEPGRVAGMGLESQCDQLCSSSLFLSRDAVTHTTPLLPVASTVSM